MNATELPTTVKLAEQLVVGDRVRRSTYAGYTFYAPVLTVGSRVLNDGKRVVDVTYGRGEGATFYADQAITVELVS